jgi:hypothetical protein
MHSSSASITGWSLSKQYLILSFIIQFLIMAMCFYRIHWTILSTCTTHSLSSSTSLVSYLSQSLISQITSSSFISHLPIISSLPLSSLVFSNSVTGYSIKLSYSGFLCHSSIHSQCCMCLLSCSTNSSWMSSLFPSHSTSPSSCSSSS